MRKSLIVFALTLASAVAQTTATPRIPVFTQPVVSGATAKAFNDFVEKNRGKLVHLNVQINTLFSRIDDDHNLFVSEDPCPEPKFESSCAGSNYVVSGENEYELTFYQGINRLNGYFVIDDNVEMHGGVYYGLRSVSAAMVLLQTQTAASAPAKSVQESDTVANLGHMKVFLDDALCFKHNSGCDFDYVSGRHFKVSSFYNQVKEELRTTDETGVTQELDYDFKDIWAKDAISGFGEMREGSELAFGQYDFTGDKPDSLVIVTVRKGENDFMKCGVNIYQLEGNKWNLAGVLKAGDVLGTCDIKFKVNKVTIPRHLRGFYHQLTYQNGHFEDTSNF